MKSVQEVLSKSSEIRKSGGVDLPLESLEETLYEMAEMSSALEDEMEELKKIVRSRAQALREPGLKKVLFPGGKVSVTFQEPRVSLSDSGIPTFLLESLFDVKISWSPKKDFRDLIRELPEEDRTLVLGKISLREENPRVGFPTLRKTGF